MPDSPDPGTRPALQGEVVYFYAFDVANEIRLDGVAEILAERPVPFTVSPARTTPKAMTFSRPLGVEFSPQAVTLFGQPVRLLVRVYEVGVVSIMVRAPAAGESLQDLIPFHRPLVNGGRPLDELARELCRDVCRGLAPCLVQPGEMTDPEAYTTFVLTHIDGERDANQWCAGHRREIAGLLCETPPERLSASQVDEVLRLNRSFESTDLVVIDWDAALVVDLDSTVEDVLLILELANLQLEEFQWMDRSLDRHLEKAYSDLRRPFRSSLRVLRSLRQMRIDLARLADEVTHATKFIGDWHLARIYLLARERFHIDQWRASVEQRLGQLDQLYTLVRGELNDRRMLWLEVIIVVFFAIDLLILLLKPGGR